MKIEFENTGTTEGFEHYYGNVLKDGVIVGSWTSKPNPRTKNVIILFHPIEKSDPIMFVNMKGFKKGIKNYI